jgi:hypothetical protein
MEPGTKVNGKRIRLVVEVNFGTLMVTSSKESGRTIKPMGKEHISTSMALVMKATGKTTYKMARG